MEDIKYTFYNINGLLERDITEYDMRKKHYLHSGSLNKLCLGKLYSTSGWFIDKDKLKIKLNTKGETVKRAKQIQDTVLTFGKFKDLTFDMIPFKYFKWLANKPYLKITTKEIIQEYIEFKLKNKLNI